MSAARSDGTLPHCTTTRDGRAVCDCGWQSPRSFFNAEDLVAWHRLAVSETIDNPYLREYLAPVYEDEIKAGFDSEFSAALLRRDRLTAKYAWAIPTELVVRRLAKFSPICDLGCGTGYWAKLLGDVGASVIAVDAHPPLGNANPWHRHEAGLSHQVVELRHFAPLIQADAATFDVPSTHTLLLCWPPYHDDMASVALGRYRGDHVIYIGEGRGGCTGDDAFHAALEDHWDFATGYKIPQWDSLHDDVSVYVRRRG